MNPELTKLIEQYLSGELTAADTQAFENRIETNETLRDAVAQQQKIHEGAKRAYQRQQIESIGKRYHFRKNLLKGGLSILIAGIITAASLFVYNEFGKNKEVPILTEEVKVKLDKLAPIDLETQYFLIPEEGGVVLSKDGVLISVPKGAFIKDGKPYKKPITLQYQEALNGTDIMKSGLSTTSNGRLLETGGMLSVTGFTADGKPLDFNPKVGVYVQVPMTDAHSDMQLYDGELKADGSINWVNPKELQKIPAPVAMKELDFYPAGYEKYLDDQKWKTAKTSRDSLYLSFEEEGCNVVNGDEEFIGLKNLGLGVEFQSNNNTTEPIFRFADNRSSTMPVWTVQDDYYGETDSIDAGVSEAASPVSYIYPSNVLAFWNKGFNNTNLATREFERRMRVIHETCDNAVLKVYTSNLDKSLKECDERVIEMGHPEFQLFAAENVGKVNAGNPHVKQLQRFYKKSIKQLKSRNSILQKEEAERREAHDSETRQSRNDERRRTANRESQAYDEEFNYNLKNVYKQLGYTRGFTIKSSSKGMATNAARSAVKNIDRLVANATQGRKSLTVKKDGKTASITYNQFTFEIENSKQYIKLFAYILPYQLNSYQRIEGKNGKFSHPLNDDIQYNIAVVGVKKDGYGFFQKMNCNGEDLGKIKLKTVSKTKLDADVKQLNSSRNNSPMRINEELSWLVQEQKDYKEQQLRKEMEAFRSEIRRIIFPCCHSALLDIEEDDGVESIQKPGTIPYGSTSILNPRDNQNTTNSQPNSNQDTSEGMK